MRLLTMIALAAALAGPTGLAAQQAGEKPNKTKAVPMVPARRPAQKSPEELKKLHDEKIAKTWVSKGNWILDYEGAREKARKSGKIIFAYFTRSYSP